MAGGGGGGGSIWKEKGDGEKIITWEGDLRRRGREEEAERKRPRR